MNSVVDSVSTYEQSDRRNMQARRFGSVRLPRIHHDQLVSFELQFVALERIGDGEMLRDLTKKKFAPKIL